MLKSSSSSDSSIELWKERIRRTRLSKISIFSKNSFYISLLTSRYDIIGHPDASGTEIKLPARVFLMSLRFSSPQTSVILFVISSFEVLSVTTSARVSDKPCSSSFIVSVSFARSLSNLKSLSELYQRVTAGLSLAIFRQKWPLLLNQKNRLTFDFLPICYFSLL